MNKRPLALGCVIFLASLAFCQQPSLAPQFSLRFDKAGVTSLKYVGDKYGTDYIADEATLGHVRIRYKMGDNNCCPYSPNRRRQSHYQAEPFAPLKGSLRWDVSAAK